MCIDTAAVALTLREPIRLSLTFRCNRSPATVGSLVGPPNCSASSASTVRRCLARCSWIAGEIRWPRNVIPVTKCDHQSSGFLMPACSRISLINCEGTPYAERRCPLSFLITSIGSSVRSHLTYLNGFGDAPVPAVDMGAGASLCVSAADLAVAGGAGSPLCSSSAARLWSTCAAVAFGALGRDFR